MKAIAVVRGKYSIHRSAFSIAVEMLCTLALLLAATANADPTPFSYSLERFTFSGNGQGTDVEEFDDGVLAPWFLCSGIATITESGGQAHFESPGELLFTELVPGEPVRWESSFLCSPPPRFEVVDGAGDFTATATWDETLPLPNQAYCIGWDVWEGMVGGGTLRNLDLCFLVAGPQSEMLGLVPGMTYASYTIGFETIPGHVPVPDPDTNVQIVPVNPNSVTGPVLLRLSFDDSSNNVTASVSVDGGLSFLFPFALPYPSGLPSGTPGEFTVQGESFEPPCGNGLVLGSEACDDGNLVGGDGCSGSCAVETGWSCTGQPSICTLLAVCPPVPANTCFSAGKSSVMFKDNVDSRKQKFSWKWFKGVLQLAQNDFGNPVNGSTSYALCVYDQTGATPSLKMGATVAPGGTCGTKLCWKTLSTKGWGYTNRAGNADDIIKVTLKGGDAGKPQAQVKGKGATLPLPAPISGTEFFDQDPAVIVQLHGSSPAACWSSTFGTSNTKKNTALQFKATAP